MTLNKLKVWKAWSELVNIDPADLRSILDSQIGRQLRVWSRDKEEQGIFSARYSAEALIRMIPLGRDNFAEALANWKDRAYKGVSWWECAKKQVLTVRKLLEKIGNDMSTNTFTGVLVVLKLWGHDLYKVTTHRAPIPAVNPETEIAFYDNPPEEIIPHLSIIERNGKTAFCMRLVEEDAAKGIIRVSKVQ